MKKQTVMDLVQKAIIDSMNYSKRDGKMIFIYVQPHVDNVVFDAYKDGWGTPASLQVYISLRGNITPTVKHAKKLLKPLYDFMKKNPNI